MEASQHPPLALDAASPDTETLLRARTRKTADKGILRLPAVLQELILQAALVHPSAFKKLILVCRSWAAVTPSLPCHLQVREGAQIPGIVLAKEMSQLSHVVSLRLPKGSVHGLLPTANTPSWGAAGAAGPPTLWTTNLEALALDGVEFQPTDLALAFTNLKELTYRLKSDEADGDCGDWMPQWVANRFPPALLRLKYSHQTSFGRLPSWHPILNFHGFPSTLVSLHIESMDDGFVTAALGDLSHLKDLTLDHCPTYELPASIGNLKQLDSLIVKGCNDLSAFPETISNLVSLSTLCLCGSDLVERYPDLGPHLHKSLHVLHIDAHDGLHDDGTLAGIVNFPNDLGGCLNLRELHLSSTFVNEVPNLGSLTALQELKLDLPELTELPDMFSTMSSLKKATVICDQLLAVPLSLAKSTSTNLEVLHLICKESLILPAIACPPNLLDLKIYSKAWTCRPNARERSRARPRVTVGLSLKKLFLSACFWHWEGARANPLSSLEDVALFCDGSCQTSSAAFCKDVPGLPYLKKLTLWCSGHNHKCHLTGMQHLARWPSLQVLQVGPYNPYRGCDSQETNHQSSTTGPPSLEIFSLNSPDPMILSSVPSPSTLRQVLLSGKGISALPPALGGCTRLHDLVLRDLNLTEAPDCLSSLRGLTSLKVTRCQKLRKFTLHPMWTKLESLHISGCSQLHSPGDSLGKLSALQSLVLGCTLMHPKPPSVRALGQLTSFEVEGCGSSLHEGHDTCLPASLWRLPALKRVAVKAGCIRELAPELHFLPSLESLSLHDVREQFLCLPRGERLMAARFAQRYEVQEARNKLRNRTNLSANWLPRSMECLTQLANLDLDGYYGSSLPSRLGELQQLTCFAATHCGNLEELPHELAALPSLSHLKLKRCPLLKVVHGGEQRLQGLGKGRNPGVPTLGSTAARFQRENTF